MKGQFHCLDGAHLAQGSAKGCLPVIAADLWPKVNRQQAVGRGVCVQGRSDLSSQASTRDAAKSLNSVETVTVTYLKLDKCKHKSRHILNGFFFLKEF